MKKIIKKILFLIKYYIFKTAEQRSLLETRKQNVGSVKLFNKDFHFHNGYAFHETYKEIFEGNIYKFNPINTNPIILDCGSNMGLSVLYFSKNYPNSQIIAFEPDAAVIPFIEKNIVSQEINNVVLHKKAVWIEETELKFFTDNGLGGRVGLEYKDQNAIVIQAVRLRDYLNQPIEFLKIDIEGAEFQVLNDCKDVLHNVNHLFVEYHSFYDEQQHLDDVLQIIKDAGFRYHLRESFSRSSPFVDKKIVCEKFDLAINIFAYKTN